MNWKSTRTNKRMDVDEDNNQQVAIPLVINNQEQQMLSSSIRTVENRIFFYEMIVDPTIVELNRLLLETDMKLQNTKTTLGDSFDPVIHLHMKTGGGEIHSAISTVDLMRTLKSKIYTYIDGSVASAGTLITVSGTKRLMGKYSNLLIHQLSGDMYGKFSEMEDTMENCTNLMKLIKSFYKQYTKIPMKKLDELLRRDLWLSADECLEYGIVDEVF